MSDYIVRATAADDQIRAFAITAREMVESARQIHGTSPVATAAFGRLLMGASMMGSMMKGEKDILTIRMRGDGPINGITVTADSSANVKGYVGNPNIVIPPNYLGKLDVGAAIGYGTMTVTKDLGMKEPYSSQINLTTSEVAEDLTYYFASSEQIPSSVALGVLMEKDNTVKQAGGFIIQLMPFAEDKVISFLEEKISKITSVTDMLESGMSPEDILNEVTGELGLKINDRISPAYKCNCSRQRVAKALISIGRKELQDMINDGKEVSVNCNFCNTDYTFAVSELKEFYNKSIS
ncbi:MAG: Hsp33 family molecular chaperone HslO [Lachnospiraceae bacterium]|nr:Hsp33 family molecular chaperone HslO [Lachnospiraceae bacterium]MDE6252188.1 Hsp33 family molecular chaperone HslO [Lachnospiraceae bacterium]